MVLEAEAHGRLVCCSGVEYFFAVITNVCASIFILIQYLTIDLPEIWAGLAALCSLLEDEAQVLRALNQALVLL